MYTYMPWLFQISRGLMNEDGEKLMNMENRAESFALPLWSWNLDGIPLVHKSQ